MSDEWEVYNPTIASVETTLKPGFELGVVYHHQFHKLFGFRAQGIISFLDSEIEFESSGLVNQKFTRRDESVVLAFPVNLIFENTEKSIRPTFSFGAMFSYDLTADANSTINEGVVERNNFSSYLEAGAGIAFQFQRFTWRPEIIYSLGLNNQGSYLGVPSAALSHHKFRLLELRFSFYGA